MNKDNKMINIKDNMSLGKNVINYIVEMTDHI